MIFRLVPMTLEQREHLAGVERRIALGFGISLEQRLVIRDLVQFHDYGIDVDPYGHPAEIAAPDQQLIAAEAVGKFLRGRR